MYSKTTIITNESGLHARPASIFVKEVKKFASMITVKKFNNDKEYPAKSLISIMSAGLKKGDEIIITAVGEDEVQAVGTLVKLLESGCGE